MVSLQTVAHRHVVVHAAFSSETADAGARIDTLIALTGLGAITVGVSQTFRAAALVRIAEVLRQTAAHSEAVVLSTLGVGATRRGVAWVSVNLDDRRSRNCKGRKFRHFVKAVDEIVKFH